MKLKTVAAAAALSLAATPFAAHAELFASPQSNWNCLANEGGSAVMRSCQTRHNSSFPYKPGENVFYGQFQQSGQCLEAQGQRAFFSACNGSNKGQIWKLDGATTQLNNELGICVVGSGAGGAVAVRSCPQRGTWANASYLRVPALASAPKGAVLTRRGNDLVDQTGKVYSGAAVAVANAVAAGGANAVAAGGANAVAAGGANMVSTGGGGVVAAGGLNGASGVVAAGGLN